MDREGFRNRLKQYKEAKGFDPLLKYWEWKLKYDSAPQPDSMPSQPQPDLSTVTSQPLDDRAHRWDNGYVQTNRQFLDSPYEDARYYDYRKPRFEFRKGDVHYGNPNLLKFMGRFGKVLRGGSLLGETILNLFPSEEAELIEDLRVKMDKQNKWLTGQEDIPKYDEGGKVIPTQEEYIAEQIAAKRAAALDKSRNRTSVRVPMISNYETEEEWKHRVNTNIRYAEELLSRLMAAGEDGDYAKAKQQELDALLEELDKGYPKLISGANCMYNAGDCYGLNIPGNETFAAKHRQLGFKKAPKGSMEPGDLVQDVRMGYPTHAMIYDSKDDENNLLFNYARGYNSTSVKENYVKQGKYPLPEKDYDVYKYVGTPADSTQWISDYKKIYGFAEGTEGVGEPGLLDRFTNTVSVLYNNAARKIKNFFENETTGEVIDLSNQRVSRITPDTKNLTAIYGNEFVENNANNIRTRKQFEETTDTLIGDKRIPLSRISNFYGIENGKLRAGDLSSFQDSTTVVPNRAKGAQRIKEIIFPTLLDKQNYQDKWTKIMEDSNQTMAHAAYELGIGFSPFFNSIFLGYASRKMLDLAKNNKTSSPAVAKWEKAFTSKKAANEKLRKGSGIRFVTESNDTIPSNISNTNKTFFANELGNSMFVNSLHKLDKQDQNKVNFLLKQHPMYPILIDNGRYSHYQTKDPNYITYTKYDFVRDPKNMYVIGTTK